MDDDPIPTGCRPVDELIGGGVERGTATQIYGEPAAGKTTLALSTAIEVAAAEGTVVYVDTEGVSVDRFRQLLYARVGEDRAEAVAGRIIIEEAHDFDDQAEAIRDAEELGDRADLVVVDSVTGFYRVERANDTQGGEALREVGRQVTELLGLARKHDVAILLTNQVFTDPEADRTRPLGGNVLGHLTGAIVRLDRFRGGKRRVTLEKPRSLPAGNSVAVEITAEGMVAGEGRGQDRS
ncbi:DNA repair and recombination protein RadB [Halobacteriales archaeon SW_7_68_16]|nr:MAG: DNA repair and recombination protein RadB [Halobacteriales archaeon SW_7_68_16]